ncbi:uncharacterized protein LTR77_001233 [Saxophila tyrrhenica]|uniref:Ubiquitin-conjugating enzyme E2 Z n=1 Tax=Saxophila tyrrhenica TaxID=1690608 RepID=A0AAV9PJJ3_9PEZI|nr:hypothetical protein LTR77_001233 [Saxophila tyrrhenica]
MANRQNTSSPNTSGATARIAREIAQVQKGSDLSLAVACQDSDVRHVRACIIGPPETPYEFGFFEFNLQFGKDYPIKSPAVTCITTNSGRCRFNPNIYNCGKVCLSILGTWRGEPGEEWSSAQGLESILLSIQSLMSAHPYENEPGHEESKKEEPEPQAYIAKIRHETLRITVIQRMEALLCIDENKIPAVYSRIRSKAQTPAGKMTFAEAVDDGSETPNTDTSVREYDAEATFAALDSGRWEPFTDMIKRRFLWYYDSYLKATNAAKSEQADGKAFTRMPFEYPPNSIEGSFDYAGLERRLKRIHDHLEMERICWESQGAVQVDQGTQLATQLAFQFKQFEHKWNHTSYPGSRMEISLPNSKNPFVWRLTIFGNSSTNLEGGIFNVTLSIPPDFPNSQPRVKFETPIFHHRVSSTGYLCYFPAKPDEIASHLEAIVKTVEDQNPTFDPRASVNPGAFALYWGGEDKRKFYNRKQRRSAQDSTEF